MTKEAYLSSLVPRMYKTEFDDKAADTLAEFCPNALETPMAVPIEQIATEHLQLTIKEYSLSEDLSILGQMCFTDGLVEIYDPAADEYREIFVKAKTMIIDPDTYMKRNLGSRRNTVSHECVHWIFHRKYFNALEALDKGRAVAHKCPVDPKGENQKEVWTDIDWLEWQANGIAPRILMPKETVEEAFQMIIDAVKRIHTSLPVTYQNPNGFSNNSPGFIKYHKPRQQSDLRSSAYSPNSRSAPIFLRYNFAKKRIC